MYVCKRVCKKDLEGEGEGEKFSHHPGLHLVALLYLTKLATLVPMLPYFFPFFFFFAVREASVFISPSRGSLSLSLSWSLG